jgi:deoxyadenosine/deoxycytidine kinase
MAESIVVVGVCSSGKSTLVRTLRDKGYNAHAVSQEHSYVPQLWQRSDPDVLIYLDANIHTIRGRGRTRWRQPLLDEEHRRLQNARDHCHLYIPTDGLAPADVASRVVTFLKKPDMRNEK